MNPWTSLSLAVGLAAAAGKLPPLLMPLASPFSPASPQKIAVSQPYSLGEVDPEVRDLAKDVLPRVELLVNPILGNLSGATSGPLSGLSAWKSEAEARLVLLRVRWGKLLALGAVGLGAGTVILSALFMAAGAKGLSRILGEAGLTLCRFWVLGLSLGGAVLFAGAGVNLWALVPWALWAGPLAGMLASAAVLRVVDLNHPVWNRLFFGFLIPLGALGFCITWGRLVGRPLF